MKLKNINGTADNVCSCDSWIAHWENFSGEKAPGYCPVIMCTGKDIVGAHVQKGGNSTNQNWYIYPLCKAHNKHVGELEVPDTYPLVSANKAKTCDKMEYRITERLIKRLKDK